VAHRWKDVRSVRRRGASRSPKRSILVVCEGAKTEPNYISFFKQELRLSNVDLEICGEQCGSDPLSVVNFAEAKFKRESHIDDCFCVIDRDKHDLQRFNAAIAKARALDLKSKTRTFQLHVSDPCVEYWFILHFEYLRRPFVKQGQKSRAEVAMDVLKTHWPDYRKGLKNTGEHLEPLLEKACQNAERALEDAKQTGETNPSTTMHSLIRTLQKSGAA